jgi:hypothetical protein
MSNYSTQRCPRCGNENRSDSFVCAFCGKRLRFEKIENFTFFKRIETDWISPAPIYLKILWLLIKPNKAFWDINHKRSKSPGYIIALFNSLLYGLLGLAIMSHFVLPDPFSSFLFNLSSFATFFILGVVFYFIFSRVLIWFFIKGANYAVGFSERLELRFGKEADRETYKQAEMSPFSIYRSGTLQQEQAFKYKMLYCAFVPFLVANLLEILIIMIGFESRTFSGDPNIFSQMFNSPTWAIVFAIDALIIAIWVPILITLAIRELSNSSTLRVLMSSLIIGALVAIFIYFLRPVFLG